MSDISYENSNVISNVGYHSTFDSGRTAAVMRVDYLLHYKRDIYRNARRQILSFAQLPKGWHYGGGNPAGADTVKLALKVSLLFVEHGAGEIEAFPDVEGGILVSGYRGEDLVDVFCGTNGRLDLLHERNGESLYEKENVDLDEAGAFIECLEWKLSDFFIRSISDESSEDSRALLSRIHRETGEFPSLTCGVPSNALEQNASIYTDSTPTYQGTL